MKEINEDGKVKEFKSTCNYIGKPTVVDIPFAADILDSLDQVLYTGIHDLFFAFQKKLWKSLTELEQRDYLQFLFMEDGRLEVKKLIN